MYTEWVHSAKLKSKMDIHQNQTNGSLKISVDLVLVPMTWESWKRPTIFNMVHKFVKNYKMSIMSIFGHVKSSTWWCACDVYLEPTASFSI